MKKRNFLMLASLAGLGILASCGIQFVPVGSETSKVTTTTKENKTTTQDEAVTTPAITKTDDTDDTTTTEVQDETTTTGPVITTTENHTDAEETTTFVPVITTTEDETEYPSTTRLDILEINDLHGYAYESSNNAAYNLASTETYIDSIRALEEYDNVLLAANGDMFQGTAFSNLSYGKSVINAMNEMDFDFMGIGNHEFDWGLEKILNYFDNEKSNGEANFPLINGNVIYAYGNSIGGNYGERVGEYDSTDDILPYTIVQKSGINVGILSYIGPLKDSINQNKLTDYTIDCSSTSDSSFYEKVRNDALAVKNAGADIIIINTHNGTSTGITDDEFDKNFAALKDDDGNYLIDAVINGHTHSYQSGSIQRDGGLEMPVVQGGSYGNAIGHIALEINTETKSVTSVLDDDYEYIDDVNAENVKDEAVQNVLDYEYSLIEDDIKEIYCVNVSYAAKNKVGAWTANIMKAYSGADVAFLNTGGIRAALPSCNVTISELYEVNPFDNNLMYVLAKGSCIINFYNANKNYYYFDSDFDVSAINENLTYKILTIDYVYYSTYFQKYFSTAKLSYEDTETFARSLMVLDCKAKKDYGMDLSTDTSASLECVGWKS